jgi:hypothetical protein
VPATDTSATPSPGLVTLTISGVPTRAVIKVDSVAADSPILRLPSGAHTVSVTASGYRKLVKLVELRADSSIDLAGELAALKIRPDPCRYPGEQYNASDECYDQLPTRIGGSAEVDLPPDFVGNPRPSILWVRVSADGRTIEVQPSQRSSRQFEELAVERAKSMTWTPAMKNGKQVTGWLQLEIRPKRR